VVTVQRLGQLNNLTSVHKTTVLCKLQVPFVGEVGEVPLQQSIPKGVLHAVPGTAHLGQRPNLLGRTKREDVDVNLFRKDRKKTHVGVEGKAKQLVVSLHKAAQIAHPYKCCFDVFYFLEELVQDIGVRWVTLELAGHVL